MAVNMNPTQKTSEGDINQMNLQMRQQPWYMDYFKSRGLNPNQVKLNDRQRAELTQLAAQNGVQLGDRMKFDEAGNLNQQGGFAGMPTWAKIALAAAPVAATAGFGAAGMGPMAGMFGGASSAPVTTSTALTSGMASQAPTLGGIGAGVGAGAGGGVGAGTALGGGAVAGGVKKAGSFMADMIKGKDQDFTDIARLLQTFGNDEANHRLNNQNNQSNFEVNRSNQIQAYDRSMLEAEASRRLGEADALKKLNQTAYIGSDPKPYSPASISVRGRNVQLPDFNLPRMPSMTGAQKDAAGTLEQTLLDRLKTGGYKPTPIEDYKLSDPQTQDYSKRGVGENIGRWAGYGAAGAGAAASIFDMFN